MTSKNNAIKVSVNMYFIILTRLIGFISLYFVSHYMGAKALGIVAFALAYVGLFQSFADLGFGDAHIKRVSEGKDFGICNGVYFSVTFFLNILMILIVISTILYSKYILNKPFLSREHEIVIYIILLSNVMGNFTSALMNTYSARMEFAKSNFASLLGKIVFVIARVAVALLGLGVILLAMSNVLSALVTLGLYLYAFRGYPVKMPTLEYFKSYFKFALPVMFLGFATKYAESLDSVMIQYFCKTEDVGRFAAGYQFPMILLFLTNSVSGIAFPAISKMYATGNLSGIREFSRKTERYSSMIIVPIIILLISFSKEIAYYLLGKDFMVSTPEIIIVLSLMVYFQSISTPYFTQIGGTNHIKLAVLLGILISVINVAFSLICIPKELFGFPLLGLGAVGAAMGTLISTIFAKVIYNIAAYRITRCKQNYVILIHIISGVLMFLVLLLLKTLLHPFKWYLIPVIGLVGLIIYLFLLIVMKEFSRNEFNYFMKNINPIHVKNYTKGELNQEYRDKND